MGNDIDNTLIEKHCILMKFGAKKNIESLYNGTLYMKNLKFYIEQEKATGDTNMGDILEGQLPFYNVSVSLYNQDTNKHILSAKSSNMNLNFGFSDYPVFCIFMFDKRNIVDIKTEKDTEIASYRFTDEQREILKKFGDTCLMITDVGEFIRMFEKAVVEEGYVSYRDKVKYYTNNEQNHFNDVINNEHRCAYWKRSIYEPQQEYRFLVEKKVEDNLSINIGDLSKISQIIETETILNSYMELRTLI